MFKETFLSVRNHTESICSPLELEDYIPQPVDFVSPPKWHLAHTTWFFETFLLKPFLDSYQVFHPKYDYLFNSYYNSLGDRVVRAERGNMSRPVLKDVMAYRKHVDQAVIKLLQDTDHEQVFALLSIGINHEQQHQELLITDLKYILGHNTLFPIYMQNASKVDQINEASGWLEFERGVHKVGASADGFSYDNEHAQHEVLIGGFSLSKALVTNAEYLEFINDDGYKRHDLWLDEGWSWINETGISSPLYWHKIEGDWHQYTLSGLKPLSMSAVLAHVSFYEAAAFAEWKGMRLPTEHEWEVSADKINWGSRWEHTSSAYLPYPGFKKPKGAVGEYNGKFMINQMVLRGASAATSNGHSRKTYRNFFHPHLQWQFSGIRLAKND